MSLLLLDQLSFMRKRRFIGTS